MENDVIILAICCKNCKKYRKLYFYAKLVFITPDISFLVIKNNNMATLYYII